MRVVNVQNIIINRNCAPKVQSFGQNFCGAKAESKIIDDGILGLCATPNRCVDFETLKAYLALNSSSVRQYTSKPHYIVPEEYIPVVEESEKIIQIVPGVLNKFNDIHPYAKNIIHEAKCTHVAADLLKTDGNHIEKTDEEGNLEAEVVFNRDGRLKLIKDYKNNRAILFDRNKNSKKYTVFDGCKNMDDSENITAKEAFTFESGIPYRYAISCKADINSDYFIAGEAFDFRNHLFKSYDKVLTVAGGTEYSKEYYEFESYAENLFDFDSMKCNFKRFVSGKVSVDDKIYYSSDDFLISQCKRLKD